MRSFLWEGRQRRHSLCFGSKRVIAVAIGTTLTIYVVDNTITSSKSSPGFTPPNTSKLFAPTAVEHAACAKRPTGRGDIFGVVHSPCRTPKICRSLATAVPLFRLQRMGAKSLGTVKARTRRSPLHAARPTECTVRLTSYPCALCRLSSSLCSIPRISSQCRHSSLPIPSAKYCHDFCAFHETGRMGASSNRSIL